MKAEQCRKPNNGGNSCKYYQKEGYEHHPVNCVDWIHAVELCTWIGGRLPKEAEWEYAARSGGKDAKYPWGNEEPSCEYAVMDDATHGSGCDKRDTWEVCSKTQGNTSHGLCDMSGNLLEWVLESYRDNYEEADSDATVWEDDGDEKVVRGGSFNGAVNEIFNVAKRTGVDEHPIHDERFGFRCVRQL